METSYEYIIKNDQVVMREHIETPVGDLRTLLNIVGKDSWTTLRNAGTVAWIDEDMKKIDIPYSLIVGQTTVYVVTNPPTLPLLSRYVKLNDTRFRDHCAGWHDMDGQITANTMRPTFRMGDIEESVLPAKYMYPWNRYREEYCKDMGQLVMLLVFRKRDEQDTFRPSGIQLAALKDTTFSVFNYPNQFESATMCLGASFDDMLQKEDSLQPSKRRSFGQWINDLTAFFLRAPISDHLTSVYGKFRQWNMEANTCKFAYMTKEMMPTFFHPVANTPLTTVYNELYGKQ